MAEWGPGQVWTFSATFKMGGLFKTCGICLEARFPVAVNCNYLGVVSDVLVVGVKDHVAVSHFMTFP